MGGGALFGDPEGEGDVGGGLLPGEGDGQVDAFHEALELGEKGFPRGEAVSEAD